MSFNIFDVSASGMHAQRLKMDTISSNIANINTTRNEKGQIDPYKKKDVSFRAVYEDQASRMAPPFPNGNHIAVYSPTSNEMFLKGGISFDEKELSKGVEVSKISESKNPYKTIYDPSHPDANEDGYVTLPNINVVEEMVNMVSASKAYEANSVAAETAKNMINSALKI